MPFFAACCKRFQSTLSVRRATHLFPSWRLPLRISIHALRKESDLGSMWGNLDLPISIHALRKESDLASMLMFTSSTDFNPRSP